MIFMSTYKNSESRLLDVDYEAVTLDSGKAIIKTLTKPLADAENAKAMVWDEAFSPILTIPAFNLK